MSLLLIHKILRVFFNTLTGNDKHYLLNRDKLTQAFSVFFSFFAFLKSILNFKHFPAKDDPHS